MNNLDNYTFVSFLNQSFQESIEGRPLQICERLRRLNVSWYQGKFFGSMFCMHYGGFTDLEGSSFHCMLGNWISQEFKLLVLWGFPGQACSLKGFSRIIRVQIIYHSWSSNVESNLWLDFWSQLTFVCTYLCGVPFYN